MDEISSPNNDKFEEYRSPLFVLFCRILVSLVIKLLTSPVFSLIRSDVSLPATIVSVVVVAAVLPGSRDGPSTSRRLLVGSS